MKNTQKLLCILTAASLTLGLASPTFAQQAETEARPAPEPSEPEMITPQKQKDEIDHLAELVGLSEAQVNEIRSVVDEATPKIQAMQAQAQALQAELQDKAGPGYDEAAIRKTAEALGKLTGELSATATIMQSKVQSVFTPEQRETLEEKQREQMQMQQQMQMQMQQQMRQQTEPSAE